MSSPCHTSPTFRFFEIFCSWYDNKCVIFCSMTYTPSFQDSCNGRGVIWHPQTIFLRYGFIWRRNGHMGWRKSGALIQGWSHTIFFRTRLESLWNQHRQSVHQSVRLHQASLHKQFKVMKPDFRKNKIWLQNGQKWSKLGLKWAFWSFSGDCVISFCMISNRWRWS